MRAGKQARTTASRTVGEILAAAKHEIAVVAGLSEDKVKLELRFED